THQTEIGSFFDFIYLEFKINKFHFMLKIPFNRFSLFGAPTTVEQIYLHTRNFNMNRDFVEL
ncbi:hypothetical protein LCGC14_3119850, partial [marine sediment metagenome]